MAENAEIAHKPKLFVLVPVGGSGRPVPLRRPLYVVGRSRHVDIRIRDRAVSKVHAILFNCAGALLIRDLGSTNGTRVNGQRIRLGVLLPGDKVSFAARTFEVRVQTPDDTDRAGYQKTVCDMEALDPVEEELAEPSSPVIRVMRSSRRR